MSVIINSIFQVWRKDSLVCVKVNIVMKYHSVLLQDIWLQTFPCHTDSVWDLKLHNNTVVKHLENQIFSKYFKIFSPPGHSGAGRCGDPVRLCVGLRSESEVLYSGQRRGQSTIHYLTLTCLPNMESRTFIVRFFRLTETWCRLWTSARNIWWQDTRIPMLVSGPWRLDFRSILCRLLCLYRSVSTGSRYAGAQWWSHWDTSTA